MRRTCNIIRWYLNITNVIGCLKTIINYEIVQVIVFNSDSPNSGVSPLLLSFRLAAHTVGECGCLCVCACVCVWGGCRHAWPQRSRFRPTCILYIYTPPLIVSRFPSPRALRTVPTMPCPGALPHCHRYGCLNSTWDPTKPPLYTMPCSWLLL